MDLVVFGVFYVFYTGIPTKTTKKRPFLKRSKSGLPPTPGPHPYEDKKNPKVGPKVVTKSAKSRNSGGPYKSPYKKSAQTCTLGAFWHKGCHHGIRYRRMQKVVKSVQKWSEKTPTYTSREYLVHQKCDFGKYSTGESVGRKKHGRSKKCQKMWNFRLL